MKKDITRANPNKPTKAQRAMLEYLAENPGTYPSHLHMRVYRALFFANPALVEMRKDDNYMHRVYITHAGAKAIGRADAYTETALFAQPATVTETQADTPADNLRQALRDVKAGNTYPVATLWQGIDSEPEAGSFQDGDKVVIRERVDFVTSIPEISRYYLNRTIGTVVELYHDITASVSVVFEPGQIWHMRPDDLELWKPAEPEAGSGAIAFDVGDYVMMGDEVKGGVTVEMLKQYGAIGHVIGMHEEKFGQVIDVDFWDNDVEYIVHCHIRPELISHADIAALSSEKPAEPEPGSDAPKRMTESSRTIQRQNQEYEEIRADLVEENEALKQERDKLLRSEDTYHQENEKLRAALEDIKSTANDGLGEWSAVHYDQLPEHLERYYFIRADATEALAEPVGE